MLTFTDIFCGAGGSSLGLSAAGLRLVLAANHWPTAITTHAANFTDADHLCADINNYDMRRLPHTDILWASPICTEASPAGKKTRRPPRQVGGQADLFEAFGHVPKAGFERTRATFHDVIRATELHRYTAVLVENVPEVADEWELFGWWVEGMTRLGYQVQYVSVSSAHIGGPDNPHAPQWRDRLYLVFTRTGVPLPDVDPRPVAYCPTCDTDVPAVQWWKRPGPHIGRYRRQYAYRCPHTTCRHTIVEPYIRPAASVIDWTNLGQRIGDRPRPLAANTLRRIEAGLAMFAEPRRACDGECVPPMLVPAGGTWATTPTSATDAPMRTRTANPNGFEAVCTPQPFLTVLRNHADAAPADAPAPTVTAGGNHLYLTTPPGAFYIKNHNGFADPARMAKPVDREPFGACTTGNRHALVIPYYTSGKARRAEAPLDTVTTNDRFALVTGAPIAVEDCRYRMVTPRESLRAQRFHDAYIVHGNRGEQTMQAGNAVSANVAQWLGQRIAAALDTTGRL